MRSALIKLRQRIARRIALERLRRIEPLWSQILAYKKLSKSTGCSWSDLWVLYSTVRQRKPREILELGPGLSTLVLAYALQENEREGVAGRITAMEEMEYYLKMAEDLLPPELRRYVSFHRSDRVDRHYQLFRGVAYRDVPEKPYDFVFVDGPEHLSPTDGEFVFDFDLISVVRRTEQPVYAIVDYRLTTSFVFQTLFGQNKARFDAVLGLCFVGPCTKHDLLDLNLDSLTRALDRRARVIGSTPLCLKEES